MIGETLNNVKWKRNKIVNYLLKVAIYGCFWFPSSFFVVVVTIFVNLAFLLYELKHFNILGNQTVLYAIFFPFVENKKNLLI